MIFKLQVFQDHPDAFVRVIQVIMVRLQRVTFTALHQYLGLSAELINQGSQKKKFSTVGGSPVRKITRDNSAMIPLESVNNIHTGGSEQSPIDIQHKETSNIGSSQPVPIASGHRYVKLHFLNKIKFLN